MKILIAEDDLIPRHMLQTALTAWDYEVVAAADGREAWEVLQGPEAPKMAILDWMMPEMDGLQVCRKVRETIKSAPTYIILLTARDASDDIVKGLQAGANDYITKPFVREELKARVGVGRNVVELYGNLAERVKELEEALVQVKQLRRLLPICSFCRKVRDNRDYWQQVETYLLDHSDLRFSHDICPECLEREINEFEPRG